MITATDIFYFLVAPLLGTTILFVIVMVILRSINFNKKGERRNDWRKLTNDLLSAQIEYHNKSVYKAFEFYVKIILAIFGGISLIALTEQDNGLNTKILIQTGGLMTVGVTILFCVLVIVHQKSKIERWKKSFKWYEVLIWNECWFTNTSITLAIFTNYVLIQRLICNL